MDLLSLQKKMLEAIISGKPAADLCALIKPGGKLKTPEDAIDVYLSGYPARLTEALGEAYESIWRVLGDEEFFSVCKNFTSTHSSHSYNLSDYSGFFTEFLNSQQPLLTEFPFLGELAKFEWQFHELFHKSPDQVEPLSQAQLAAVDGKVKFTFISSLQIFDFKYSSYSIWRQRGNDENSRIDFSAPESIIMYKVHDQMIRTLPVEIWQSALIALLFRGELLEDALQVVSEKYDLGDEKISSFFSIIFNSNIIASISK